MTKIMRGSGSGRMQRQHQRAMLTDGGKEDRDKDNHVRRWWRKDATLASTGSGEENRDDNNDDHCARWWW